MALYDYQGNVIAVGGSGESPLAGKKICLIGDSNTQYNANGFKTYFEETYGCSFTPNGTAGATWELRDGYASAVEKVDEMIANADESTSLCTDYDFVLIMMGTNCSAVGTVEDTSAITTTMCGAIRYCLEKLLYYYRKSKIGVILPPQRADGNDSQLERNTLIQQICEEYSIPTLDLNRRGQIVPNAKTPDGSNFYVDDGLHFGANGVIQFEETVGKWMAYGMQGGSIGGAVVQDDEGTGGTTVSMVSKDYGYDMNLVQEGAIESYPLSLLPEVTAANNGSILRVVDGKWAVADAPESTLPDASEVAY